MVLPAARDGQPRGVLDMGRPASQRPCHGVHCSRKHMGKAEEDRLTGCVGLPASRPRPPPDIIAPGGNGRPSPTQPLTAAGKFLTSCLAFQPCPAPPWCGGFCAHCPPATMARQLATCILFLTTMGMAEAMLPITLPSTSKGAGWHYASVPVPHLLTTPSLPSASWVAGDPLSCALGPLSTLSVPSPVGGIMDQDLAWVPGAQHSTGAGAGRATGMWQPHGRRFGGAAALGRTVPPSHSSSHPTHPPAHPTQPRSVCSPKIPRLD